MENLRKLLAIGSAQRQNKQNGSISFWKQLSNTGLTDKQSVTATGAALRIASRMLSSEPQVCVSCVFIITLHVRAS